MLQYEISEAALADLNNIWHYSISEWSIDRAESYYLNIFGSIDQICQHPFIGRAINQVKNGYRMKYTGMHILFYKINEDVIYIDRILHQSMDYENGRYF